MGIDIRACRPDELERLISLLDEEFVFGKGRTISLQQRFPSVYCNTNLHNIWVCMEGDEIASALAMSQFDWREGDEIFRGAMIGAVYTHPAHRKKGLASRLLDTVAAQLRKEGIDFGVLWAGQQSFYSRLGWIAADNSVLGEFIPSNPLGRHSGGVNSTSASADSGLPTFGEGRNPAIENIRSNYLPNMILRNAENYLHLPLPAENVDVLLQENQNGAAFAILGSTGETGFLYELVGEPACFPDLWAKVCCRYKKLFINDQSGSSFVRWLNRHAHVSWEIKSLAMWLPLSERVNIPRLERWHIPYFDRM